MPTWVITLISVAASALVSGVVGFLVKRALDKYFVKKDKEEQDRELRLQELDALREERMRRDRRNDVREVVQEEIKPLSEKVDILTDKVSKTEEGTLSSLRNDILTCYYRCVEKGYRGDWDFENIHHLYEAYSSLHGNSFVGDVIRRFDTLPTKEEFEKSNKRKTLNEVNK